MTQSQKKQLIKGELKALMKKHDVVLQDVEEALSEMKKVAMPEGFGEYFDFITEQQFRRRFSDYVDTIPRADECKSYEFTFLSWMHAKRKYRYALEDEELDLLQLVEEDDGTIHAVTIHDGFDGERAYYVELEEIQIATGTDIEGCRD